jgi:hypothetical protein
VSFAADAEADDPQSPTAPLAMSEQSYREIAA